MMANAMHKGFTLIEILIAMAIFTMIGLASTALLTTIIDSNELSSERFTELQQLQRAMMIIERDVLQAMARPIRINGEGNKQVLVGGANINQSEADGLALVRGGWQNPQLRLPRSTLQAVGYRLQDNNLERLYGNYVDNVIGYEPKVRVLLQQINDFRVQFLTADKGSNNSNNKNWNDSYKGTVLPQAIAIEIDSQTFGLIRREFLLSGGSK